MPKPAPPDRHQLVLQVARELAKMLARIHHEQETHALAAKIAAKREGATPETKRFQNKTQG
jgi:hypothetical protein